jgi:hypothetical protein
VSAGDFATLKQGYLVEQGDSARSPDIGYLREQGDPGGSPDVDLDGDGIVTGTDLSRFHPLYLKPSGPSGLACAGTPPCP